MRLIDAPIGLFEHNGVTSLKTEYSTEHQCGDGTVIATPDCYTVVGGEYFWGGATNVHDRNNLDVIPISDAAPVVHCRDCRWGQKDDAGVMHCHKYHIHKKADGYCDDSARMDLLDGEEEQNDT